MITLRAMLTVLFFSEPTKEGAKHRSQGSGSSVTDRTFCHCAVVMNSKDTLPPPDTSIANV